MPTKAKIGRGGKLQRGDGGGTEVFTTIAEVKSVSGPSSDRAMVEATSMDSTEAEVVPGILSNGEVTFACHLIDSDAQHQGLFTDLANATLRNFKFIANNHATEGSKSVRSFAAYVKSVSEEYPFDGVMMRNVTLAISGAITRTFAPA